MQRKFYPAIFEKAGKNFSVFFPDIPGCVSAGKTIEETFVNAHEALASHIALMVEDSETIPSPSTLDAATAEAVNELEDFAASSLVSVALPGKSKRINVTLDEALLEEIDAVCDNRSGFLASAARCELAKKTAGAEFAK